MFNQSLLTLDKQKIETVIRACYELQTFVDVFFGHIKVKIGNDNIQTTVDTPYYHHEIRDAISKNEDVNIIVAR